MLWYIALKMALKNHTKPVPFCKARQIKGLAIGARNVRNIRLEKA